MQGYEYRVVPAPVQGRKARGLKSTAARFAHALESLMNEMGADGWEYVRADTLPCEERTGLTGRTTTFQNVLVFRRAQPGSAETATAPDVAGLLGAPLPELGMASSGAAAEASNAASGAAPDPSLEPAATSVEARGPDQAEPADRTPLRGYERLVGALSRPGTGSSGAAEPPLTRSGGQPERAEQPPARETSDAARAAAAALRVYGENEGSRPGARRGRGGMAAE